MPTTSYSTPTVSVATIGARTDAAGEAVSDLSAEESRLPLQILTEGYLKPSNAFQVVIVPETTVARVGSGVAKGDHYVVAGDAGGQGNYIVRLDVANVDVQLDAADASQTRTDELYLVVQDNVYDASARALPQIGYRKGDLGGANPGPDTSWKASALLARVTVAAGAVQAGPVTDQRVSAQLLTNLAVADHGALTGLADDDHPQYLTQARADARYYTESESNSLLAGKSSNGHSHSSLPAVQIDGGTYITGGAIYVGEINGSYLIVDRPAASGRIAAGLTVAGSFKCDTLYTGASNGAINGLTDKSSPHFGMDAVGSSPYLKFFWNGSNVQLVRVDTNVVVKTFVIDHPTDPKRHLVHATTESPHNGVEYWGEAVVEDGRATVTLPAYFEGLCRAENRQVQVSVVLPDEEASVAAGPDKVEMADVMVPGEVETDEQGRKRPGKDRKVKQRHVTPGRPGVPEYVGLPQVAASAPRNGRFRIACSGPDGTRVAWLVKAERKDVPKLDAEPLRADNVLMGDGPYTYLVPRKTD